MWCIVDGKGEEEKVQQVGNEGRTVNKSDAGSSKVVPAVFVLNSVMTSTIGSHDLSFECKLQPKPSIGRPYYSHATPQCLIHLEM